MAAARAAVAAATREGPAPRAAGNDAEVASALAKLHELLIAPIADKLSAEGRVVFFPHGAFVLTPFAALRSSAAGSAPLLDSHTVHVGVSMRPAAAHYRRPPLNARGRHVILNTCVNPHRKHTNEFPGASPRNKPR